MKKVLPYLLIMIIFSFAACSQAGSTESFGEQRKNGTTLVQEMPSPQDYEQDVPPDGVVEVTYMSGGYKLMAWITAPPDDEKKHPAVVYAHGGFAFGLQDWLDIQPYIDAGYQVMVPMRRGENGNPGSFEMFFGEVDDIIAAGEFFAKQPYIDNERLFLAGHSTGGTLALLTAMLPSPYRAVASFEGAPDMQRFLSDWPDEYVPFQKEQREYDIRSANKHAADLMTPLYIYLPTEKASLGSDNKAFYKRAIALGKTCELNEIKGDHISMLPGCIRASIQAFEGYGN